MVSAQRILCPIDFSACSRRALQFAAALAGGSDAKLTVLNVGETVNLYPALVVQVAPVQVAHPTRAERAREAARFIAPWSDLHAPIDVVLKEGDVAGTIAATAAEQRADLIVMGTHGHRGFRRLVIGSIAKRVVHTADCPVLVVPPGPAPQPVLRGFERIVCCGAARALAHARLFAADRDLHVDVLPEGLPARDVLERIEAARADLVVWNQTSHPIDDIIGRSIAPILVVHDAAAASWRRSAAATAAAGAR